MKLFEIPKFQTVIKDSSPRQIPDGCVSIGENVLFEDMYVRDKFGISQLTATIPERIMRIAYFERMYDDPVLVVFGLTDIYKYDEDSSQFKIITRCYNVGTATSSGTTVTISSGVAMDSVRLTGTYKVSFDNADPNECTTWVDAEITGEDTFTVGADPSVSGSAFCLRLIYNTDEDIVWSVCFPYGGGSGSYGDEKVLLATNGIDFMQIWTGSGYFQDIPATTNPNIYKHVGYWGSGSGGHIVCSAPYDGVTASENYNAIEISDVNDIDWSSGATEALYDVDSPIVGVMALGSEYLAIYKERTISLAQVNYSGSASSPFTIKENVRRNIGAPCIDVVSAVDNAHIFFSGKDICSFDGFNIQSLAPGNIKYIFKKINKEKIHRSFSKVILDRNLYLLFLPWEDSESPNMCVALNYKTGAVAYWQFETISVLSFSSSGNFMITFNPIWSDYTTETDEDNFNFRWNELGVTDGLKRIALGTDGGILYELGSEIDDDAGVDTVSLLETKDYELNKGLTFLFQECRIRAGVRQRADETFRDCTYRVRASVDYGRNWSDWTSFELDADIEPEEFQEYKAAFLMRGKAVRIQLEFTGNFNLEGIALGFNDSGSSFKWDR